MERLTQRQERFCQEYARTGNASEAARRAGYKGQANVVGAQNLAKDSICARLSQLNGLAKAREPEAVLELLTKRMILAQIARDPKMPAMARIRAIAIDHKICGGKDEEQGPVDFVSWCKKVIGDCGGPRAFAAYRERFLAAENRDCELGAGSAFPEPSPRQLAMEAPSGPSSGSRTPS